MNRSELDQDLLRAIEEGSLDDVRRLLSAGASANAARHDEPALTIAVDRGQADIVDLLLAAGAKPDACDNRFFTALHVAIMKKRFLIADALLAAGANIDFQKNPGYSSSALHIAISCDIREGETSRVAFLLDNGADTAPKAYIGRGALRQTGDAFAQAASLEGGERILLLLQNWVAPDVQQSRQEALRRAGRRHSRQFRL